MNKSTIKIAIADDHDIVRYGLISLLESYKKFKVIAEAQNGINLLELLKQHKELPDIAILDIDMPDMNGYETAKEIGCNYPTIKIMSFSFHSDEFNIIKMIKCGAVGYITKGAITIPGIIKAIESVYQDGYYYSESISKEFFEKANKTSLPEIKDKEYRFLVLCCDGLSNKEIAEKMFVGHRTVEDYYSALCTKLNVKGRIEMVAFAFKTGLVPL